MTPTKRLGIFMDHSTAHLMEFTVDPIETTTIESNFTHNVKEESLEKGEHLMHNKEQHQQAAFYKKLSEEIKHYDNVILFGPTEAKNELFNILKADHHFSKINLSVKNTDKLTENQQHAFVKDYFSLHKII
jgi:stalled ribosome rescue protein Dom34